MKNKIILKIAAAFMFAFFLNSETASAQAVCNGYSIDNNSSCSAKVSIQRLCVVGTSTFSCGPTIANIIISAGSSYIVPGCPTPCSSGICNYVVTLVELNGITPSPIIQVKASNPLAGPTGTPAGCSAQMHYLLGYTKIY